jgi:fructose-1,6-bisphosphatase/inositol monophosphatase family enzyme
MTLTSAEKSCIDAFRAGQPMITAGASPDDTEAWLRFVLSLLLEAGSVIRRIRPLSMRDTVQFKSDGTPATREEQQIEHHMRERLAAFCPEAVLVGEESGGELPTSGLALAVDPVDGTWALVNRTETCATSLAVFRDGVPFLGMVLNPATAEIGYATSSTGTRLVQLSAFGEGDVGCQLPADRVPPGSVLVNVHPNRYAAPLVSALFDEWRRSGLSMVRLPGGSPSWALLEAAKGSFVYVNLWTRRPADPYDLASGIMLVRGAGGEVTDVAGTPVDMLEHRGPFIASVDEDARAKVAAIAAAVADRQPRKPDADG